MHLTRTLLLAFLVILSLGGPALAQRRERLLTTDVAAQMLLSRVPDKAEEVEEEDLVEIGRSIALFHLDRLVILRVELLANSLDSLDSQVGKNFIELFGYALHAFDVIMVF